MGSLDFGITPPGRPHPPLEMGTKLLRWERVRAVMRLLDERRELGGRTEAAREHVMTGLLDLVGGAIGAMVVDRDYRVGATNSVARATLAGFDDACHQMFQAHRIQGAWINPFHSRQIERVVGAAGGVFVATVDDLMPRRTWYEAPWVTDCAHPARLDHFLATTVVIDGRREVEGIAFMRALGDKPFSEEDRDLLELVHLECGRLFEANAPRVSPRMHATLEQLMTGAPDKEIAGRLNLSVHTVRQYVKALLRAYGCASRTELMAQMFGQRGR